MNPSAKTAGESSLPYVVPFALILVFLAVGSSVELGLWRLPLETVVVAGALLFLSRGILTGLRLKAVILTILLGAAVFVIWIGPDLIIPGYRRHWLFENSITGDAVSSLPVEVLASPPALALRCFRAIVLVPIAEELFWRGWLMRWIINANFWKVNPLPYSPLSFWGTAILFASEHGPYWEVGLAAGILYNWWMLRTQSLGDCILAHSVTNALLSASVLAFGWWQYWM